MMPLRAAIPSTVKNPTSDPSDSTPPPRYAASTPPTSAIGRVRNESTASRQLPNEAWSRRKTPIAAAIAKHEQPLLGGLPLGELPEQLRAVLERELDRPRAASSTLARRRTRDPARRRSR